MAALLNATKNTDTYNAHDIMRTLYPEVSEQDLPNCATFPNQMIEYGKSQGRDIHYQEGVPSYEQVDQLTKDNVGIMILAQSVSQNPNDPHLGHALAVVEVMLKLMTKKNLFTGILGIQNYQSRCRFKPITFIIQS